MGILQNLGLAPRLPTVTESAPDPQVAELSAEVDTLTHRLEESLAQLRREDTGWALIGPDGNVEPDHAALVSAANLVRAASGMNPLMVRAKNIRSAYVWGSGVTIAAPDNGAEAGHQDVSAVVDAYIGDEGNQKAVFGPTARIDLEHDNFCDGNVLFAHWVNPLTGEVKVRTIPFDEITDKITAPGDRTTTWYYLRQWVEQLPHETTARTMQAWYPDLDFDPITKPQTLQGKPVMWPGTTVPGYGSGAAVYHLMVNPIGRHRKWGVGDGYAARPWAFAYKEFLEDTKALYRALAKIAHSLSGTTDKNQLARATANAAAGPAGGFVYGNDLQVSTPSFTGIDPKMGRPYAAMVASAVGVAVTILTADPGQEGARAVAETLDKPLRLTFEARQELWAAFIRSSIRYRIKMSVRAPRGELKGRVEQVRDRTEVVFTDSTDPTVQVDFPPIEDDNLTVLMEAITKADATGKLPPLEVLRLLLRALDVENGDEILHRYTDDDGEWIDPYTTAASSAGQAAADTLRAGGDPAQVL